MRILIALLLSLFTLVLVAQNNAQQRVLLPTGWSLSPAGSSLPLGDFPMNMAISQSGKWLAALNNGEGTHSLQMIDTRRKKVIQSIELPCGWLGLAFSKDEKSLFVSGGNKNEVYRYAVSKQGLALRDTIAVGKPFEGKISLAGLCVDDANRLVYVVSKENNCLYGLDIASRKIAFQEKLSAEAYTCSLSPNGKMLFISLWGAGKVAVWDTKTRKLTQEIIVGDNPNDIAFRRDGKFAFVSNADDNSVSVIDILQMKVVETLVAALTPNAPTGSTTNSVALSPNGNTLYIANADNNCLAVFDVSKPGQSASKGFIPVGWYPTCVRVAGKQVFVANGKGFSSFANPNGPDPTSTEQRVAYQKSDTAVTNKIQYIGSLMQGSLSIINAPNDKEMWLYSMQVYNNTPNNILSITQMDTGPAYPIPAKMGDTSPIKHVFYIVKENRTYDQVLGDMPEGNGDPSLCLFPESVTPNQHALAREFVLLDNFYVAAEVSADGHNWSVAAYANDFVEKTWVQSYGGRGGEYVFEGQAKIGHPKGGFIWDHCQRQGISYRTYGEFADDYKANIAVLENHFCPYYTSWDTRVRDTTRFGQWRRDFDSLVIAGALPQLNTLRFINDHTEGLNHGGPSPFAQVADNDLAVGLFIEHLSKSPVWATSVVFILEDDAQNGADHVDAHRSIAFVVSPYTRRHFRDTTLYTTNAMLRTIGLILGMPPMSQHDQAATPMWRCFTDQPNLTPYSPRIPTINLDDRNASVTPLAKQFEYFDFAGEDRVPDKLFNQLLWKAIKGEHSNMPAPRRGGWLKPQEDDDDD